MAKKKTEPKWDEMRALGPTEVIVYGFTMALWEAERRGDLTRAQVTHISDRGDELIRALVQGKAIVKNAEDSGYEIVEPPLEVYKKVQQDQKTSDVLVIKH